MKLSNYPAKYEVLIKQYLRSILDISDTSWYKEFAIGHDKVIYRGVFFSLQLKKFGKRLLGAAENLGLHNTVSVLYALDHSIPLSPLWT